MSRAPAALQPTQADLARMHAALASPGLLNMVYALAVEGPFSVSALASALTRLVTAFPALRTRTWFASGSLKAEIVPPSPVGVAIHRCEGMTPEEAVRKLIRAERSAAFDLSTPPLLRASVIRVEPDLDVLVLTFHHMAADGWSLNLFAQALSRYYEEAVNGVASIQTARMEPSRMVTGVDVGPWQEALWSARLGGIAAEALDPFGPVPLGGNVLMRRTRRIAPIGNGVSGRLLRRLRVTPFAALVASVAAALALEAGSGVKPIGLLVTNRHSTAALADGAPYYAARVAVIEVQAEDTIASLVRKASSAVSDSVACRLSYTRLVELLTADSVGRMREPACFAMMDRHPLGTLHFADTVVSPLAVDPEACRPAAEAIEVESLACGRLSFFVREGEEGAALNVFFGPGLRAPATRMEAAVASFLLTLHAGDDSASAFGAARADTVPERPRVRTIGSCLQAALDPPVDILSPALTGES